jgi:hypothetical protein
LNFKDLDGEGANAPVVTVAAQSKHVKWRNNFRDDLANPAIDITLKSLPRPCRTPNVLSSYGKSLIR